MADYLDDEHDKENAAPGATSSARNSRGVAGITPILGELTLGKQGEEKPASVTKVIRPLDNDPEAVRAREQNQFFIGEALEMVCLCPSALPISICHLTLIVVGSTRSAHQRDARRVRACPRGQDHRQGHERHQRDAQRHASCRTHGPLVAALRAEPDGPQDHVPEAVHPARGEAGHQRGQGKG